jgi:hypothetical protein
MHIHTPHASHAYADPVGPLTEVLWRLQLRQEGKVACELASRYTGFEDHMPYMTAVDRFEKGQAVEPR